MFSDPLPFLTHSLVHTGGQLLPYGLDESRNWAMDIDSLKAAVAKARGEGKCVRGLVFINPGNPTGQCLTYDNLKVGVAVLFSFLCVFGGGGEVSEKAGGGYASWCGVLQQLAVRTWCLKCMCASPKQSHQQ
jgi:hypothetical protein